MNGITMRLPKAEQLAALKEYLAKRNINLGEAGGIVFVHPDGTEVTEEFLVEVRDISLLPAVPLPLAPRQRPVSFAQPSANEFPGESDDEGGEDAESRAIRGGLETAGQDEDADHHEDFSTDKTKDDLLRMMSPADRRSVKNLETRLKNGGSLTRAPTRTRVFSSLSDAGKGPGDMSDEIE